MPNGVFFKKDEFLVFDFVDFALEKILFFLFFISKDQEVVFALNLNVLDVNDDEFFFKRYRIEVFELNVILVNLIKSEAFSLNCNQKLLTVT